MVTCLVFILKCCFKNCCFSGFSITSNTTATAAWLFLGDFCIIVWFGFELLSVFGMFGNKMFPNSFIQPHYLLNPEQADGVDGSFPSFRWVRVGYTLDRSPVHPWATLMDKSSHLYKLYLCLRVLIVIFPIKSMCDAQTALILNVYFTSSAKCYSNLWKTSAVFKSSHRCKTCAFFLSMGKSEC